MARSREISSPLRGSSPVEQGGGSKKNSRGRGSTSERPKWKRGISVPEPRPHSTGAFYFIRVKGVKYRWQGPPTYTYLRRFRGDPLCAGPSRSISVLLGPDSRSVSFTARHDTAAPYVPLLAIFFTITLLFHRVGQILKREESSRRIVTV